MRSWSLQLLAVLLLAALFLLGNKESSLGPREASLVVDFGNGVERSFRGEVAAGMTARTALAAVITGNTISVEYDPNTGEVQAVEGVSGRWVFEKNGRALTSSPQDIPVKAGDRLKLRRIP